MYTLPEGYEAAYTDSLSNRSRSHTTAHEVALHLNYTDRTWEINAGLSVVPERQSLDQKTGRMQADTLRTSVNYYPAVTVLWHKRNTGATKLRGRHETAGTDRTADTDRQQRSAEHYTGKSQPAPFVQPKGALRSTRHEDRFERRHDLGEHGEQCDTGCDVQYPNRRYRKLSRECERELERKSHRAIPEAHQTPISVTARTGASFSQNVSLINEGQQEMPERSTTHNTTLNANLRFGYQPQWGGFDLTGDWRFRHSTNLLRETGDYTRDYRLGVNAYADLPGGIQLRSDVDYSFRNGTNITPGEDDQVVWNASLSWRFLKQKKAELSFYWADILSQKRTLPAASLPPDCRRDTRSR